MNRFAFSVALVASLATGAATYGQGSDDCASAQDITGLTSVAVDTTVATTTAPAIPGAAANCPGTAFGAMFQDVWFSWTAPGNGNLTLTTCGLVNFDTDIAVHSGDCLTPVQVACNGDGPVGTCPIFESLLQDAQVQGGTTYLIQVGGWDATQAGTGTMDITFSPGILAPVNLDCVVDPGTGIVTATFDLLDTFDNLRVYIDGALDSTIANPPAGANTYISPALAGGVHDLCFESETAGAFSAQSCCNAFVPIVCPPSDGTMVPVATTLPLIGCVSCNAAGLHTDNSYFRSFDVINAYGVNSTVQITCVTTAIDASNTATTQPVRVRLHYDLDGGAPTNIYTGPAPGYVQPASAVMFYEEEFQVPAIADQLYNFVLGTGVVNPDGLPGLLATPEPGCLSAQSAAATLVVEIFTPNGQAAGNGFFMAATSATTEIGLSHIYAPGCGLTTPVATGAIGFATNRYVMDVAYDVITPAGCTGGGGVTNLACDQNPGTTTATATWASAGGVGSWRVEVDSVVVATLPPATLTFTTAALTAYTAADIVVTAWSGAGATGSIVNFQNCTVNVAPENNWIEGAEPITTGVTPFNITNAVAVNGPELDAVVCDMNIGDQQIWNDLYYCFTAGVTGDVVVSTCSGTTFDTRLAIYVGNCLSNAAVDVISCNDDAATGATTPGGTLPGSTNPACTNFAAELTFAATAGTSYLIRVGTFNAAGLGAGELTINDCLPPQGLVSTYNCTTGDVGLTWTANPLWTSLAIERDNVLLATLGGGATSYTDLNAPDGDHVYEVISDCGSGPNPASLAVSTLRYTDQTDLVIAMEGLLTGGDLGTIDSGAALLAALLANGRDAGLVRMSIADYACASDAGVENLWILTGTFPDDYRIDVAEGDLLGTLGGSGKNIYFEGGDHFGFVHVASGFDARDGVNDGNYDTGDGNDSFTSMDGLSGAGLDLSALANILYSQDQTGTDFTDQLVASTTDGAGPDAAAVWKIDDALALGAYNTTIAYNTNAGGKTISSSWEIGGYGGVLNDLVDDYLGFFGPPVVLDAFLRGDCNIDNTRNIADAIHGLGALFPPPGGSPNPIPCRDACDANDDGAFNIADMIALLGNLFPPGGVQTPIPPPYTACGVDPTADPLDCVTHPCP